MWMMFVWLIWAQARASTAKLFTAAGSSANSRFISFTATSRPRAVSQARYTVPMPPDAISERSSYCRSIMGIITEA